MNSHGRVAVITGGGQGIGKAIAKRLLEQGDRVVVAEIDQEAADEAGRELKPLGDLEFIRTDIACEEQVVHLIEETGDRFGRIDILVNNAAIGRTQPISDLSLSDWNKVIAVNLTGAFLCSKHAVPYLRKVRGCIVNISSTRALMSEPNTEAYSASKGGLIALTHALAVSLGPEIRVNCISPGWIEVGDWKKTKARSIPDLRKEDHLQHPAGRVGRPEDIAAAVCFLASTEAGFITGQNFTVDGGMTRKMIYLE